MKFNNYQAVTAALLFNLHENSVLYLVIFYINLVILLTFLSLMITTFFPVISVLFVWSCFNVLGLVGPNE